MTSWGLANNWVLRGKRTGRWRLAPRGLWKQSRLFLHGNSAIAASVNAQCSPPWGKTAARVWNQVTEMYTPKETTGTSSKMLVPQFSGRYYSTNHFSWLIAALLCSSMQTHYLTNLLPLLPAFVPTLCLLSSLKTFSSREEAYLYICMLSHFSCVWLFVTLWTLACQAPLSIGFSRPE